MAFKLRPFSLFKVPSGCMRSLGIWPGPENQALDRKHFGLFILNCVFTAFVLVFQLNFAFNSTDDISAMIESLVLSITRILVIIKLVNFLLKYREFNELLEIFDSLVTDGELISVIATN
jgi:hypothetical protein